MKTYTKCQLGHWLQKIQCQPNCPHTLPGSSMDKSQRRHYYHVFSHTDKARKPLAQIYVEMRHERQAGWVDVCLLFALFLWLPSKHLDLIGVRGAAGAPADPILIPPSPLARAAVRPSQESPKWNFLRKRALSSERLRLRGTCLHHSFPSALPDSAPTAALEEDLITLSRSTSSPATSAKAADSPSQM